jgi:hypothetical protein
MIPKDSLYWVHPAGSQDYYSVNKANLDPVFLTPDKL